MVIGSVVLEAQLSRRPSPLLEELAAAVRRRPPLPTLWEWGTFTRCADEVLEAFEEARATGRASVFSHVFAALAGPDRGGAS